MIIVLACPIVPAFVSPSEGAAISMIRCWTVDTNSNQLLVERGRGKLAWTKQGDTWHIHA
jgi:hypothetical protein